jgi:hypothetical protein
MADQPQWVNFVIRLTPAERGQLRQMVDAGKPAGAVLKCTKRVRRPRPGAGARLGSVAHAQPIFMVSGCRIAA